MHPFLYCSLLCVLLVLESIQQISAQITTTTCEDILTPLFLDNQRRALSVVITLPDSGRVAFAKEEISIRAMCSDPLRCGTIVHNSYMPIAFSDDVTCSEGREQIFSVQQQRGLFFDPFHLNIYPSGRVTFSPSQPFCKCSLQPADFMLTCHNGHIFGFDANNNMYTFIFENITSFTHFGTACTDEASPPSILPVERKAQNQPPIPEGITPPGCTLAVNIAKTTKKVASTRRYIFDLIVTNVGACTARDIQVSFSMPRNTVVKKYDVISGKVAGLESLKSGESFLVEAMIASDEYTVTATAKSVCSECT